MTQLLTSILVLSFSLSTFAAADITEVDRFLGNQTFADAFVLKDYVVVNRTSCITANFCDSFESSLVVSDKNDLTAQLEVWDAGGRKQQYNWTRDQWRDFNGNILRNTIRYIESFGQRVELQSIAPLQVTIEVNKKPTVIEALEVRAITTNALKIVTHYRWIIGKGLGAVGQILLSENTSKSGKKDSNQVLSFSRSAQR